jgi:hypothetical protein
VLGLLPYAYSIVADGPASWGEVSTPSELLAMVLRSDYGGATGFLLGGADVPWTASVAACLATIARSWLWLGAAAGVGMLAVRIWRPVGESRWAWALLAASFVISGPVLASRFNLDPQGLGLYVWSALPHPARAATRSAGLRRRGPGLRADHEAGHRGGAAAVRIRRALPRCGACAAADPLARDGARGPEPAAIAAARRSPGGQRG